MEGEQLYESKTIVILLIIGSLILMANGVFTVQLFSNTAGHSSGGIHPGQPDQHQHNIYAAVRGGQHKHDRPDHTRVLHALPYRVYGSASRIPSAHTRAGKSSGGTVIRHTPMHLILALIYGGLILIIAQTFGSYRHYPPRRHLLRAALCLIFGVYMQYQMRKARSVRKATRSISIDPSLGNTNLANLRERLFDNLVSRGEDSGTSILPIDAVG